MATPLLDDVISNIPLEFDNAAGNPVASPGGIASVVLDNAAMGTVAMGTDGKSVDFTPHQPPDDTQTGTISYSDTLASGRVVAATLDVSLTADQTASRAHFVTTGITTRALGT